MAGRAYFFAAIFGMLCVGVLRLYATAEEADIVCDALPNTAACVVYETKTAALRASWISPIRGLSFGIETEKTNNNSTLFRALVRNDGDVSIIAGPDIYANLVIKVNSVTYEVVPDYETCGQCSVILNPGESMIVTTANSNSARVQHYLSSAFIVDLQFKFYRVRKDSLKADVSGTLLPIPDEFLSQTIKFSNK